MIVAAALSAAHRARVSQMSDTPPTGSGTALSFHRQFDVHRALFFSQRAAEF